MVDELVLPINVIELDRGRCMAVVQGGNFQDDPAPTG
jgi:hypothetical protein